MEILAKVGAAMQELFGERAQSAADDSGVIVRIRKFTPGSLARTFVLGFLKNPAASDEMLAQMAAHCGPRKRADDDPLGGNKTQAPNARAREK